jgi:hypothetical protein
MNTEQSEAIKMQEAIHANQVDINHVLTQSKIVMPLLHNHYVNMENKSMFHEKHVCEQGAFDLLCSILKDADAIFTKGIESTEYRQLAIKKAMLASEIVNEVQSRFSNGSIRYPSQSIKSFLSNPKINFGKIIAIQLTNNEDKNRPANCYKPRKVYYIVKEN